MKNNPFFLRGPFFLRIFIQKIFKIGVYKKNGHRKKNGWKCVFFISRFIKLKCKTSQRKPHICKAMKVLFGRQRFHDINVILGVITAVTPHGLIRCFKIVNSKLSQTKILDIAKKIQHNQPRGNC